MVARIGADEFQIGLFVIPCECGGNFRPYKTRDGNLDIYCIKCSAQSPFPEETANRIFKYGYSNPWVKKELEYLKKRHNVSFML